MTDSNPLRNSDIRESNEKMILSMIRGSEGISQSQVVVATGLKAPTVLRTFKNLEDAGWIEPFDKKVDTGDKKGRKPVFYRLKKDSLFSVGVEFWSGGASFAIENFDRDIIVEEVIGIERDRDWENVVRYMEEKVEQIIRMASVPRDRILGLGIGVPGQVDDRTGEAVHYSRFDNFKKLNIKELYQSRLGLDVSVCNNTTAIAYGEHYFGRIGEFGSVFSFLLRGGVGGAFINKGEVFATDNRTSIEVGHFSVDYHGRQCECGNRGCLEAYLSERAILADLGHEIDAPSPKDLVDRINFSAPRTQAVLDEKALVLSQVVRNLKSVFAPEAFVLLCRNEELGRYLCAKSEEFLQVNPSNRWQSDIRILPMLYDSSAGSRGAAELVFRNYLKK
jgi:predicted NBD/HSP70 family sugar kinase